MRHAIFLVVALSPLAGCAPSLRPAPAAPPLHVLVLQDVSRSLDGLVPRLDPVDLEPVLDAAQSRGGVVAFGSFGRVARPLVRVRFTPPRLTHGQHQNVFLRSPAEEDQAEQEYLAQALEQRETFLAAVAELLEESASHTNLVSALSRVEVFFDEARNAHKALVIISDLQDTTGVESFTLTLDSGVCLFLVSHTNREFGLLADQADRFLVFESVPAALRAVLED